MLQPLICDNTRLISIRTTANDHSHIKDNINFNSLIQNEQQKLFDRIFPISTRILAHRHKKITPKSQDWQKYDIKRMAELLRYKYPIFGFQLLKNGYLHSFRELFQEVDSYYDACKILYENRKSLFLKEIE